MELNNEKSDVNCDQEHRDLSAIRCCHHEISCGGVDGTNSSMIRSEFVKSQAALDQSPGGLLIEGNEKCKVLDSHKNFTSNNITCDEHNNLNSQTMDNKYFSQKERIMGGSIPSILYTRQIYGSFGANDITVPSNRIKRSLYYTNILQSRAQFRNQKQGHHRQNQHQKHLLGRYQDYAASRIAW
jgi:hypothetical protein